jgi:hypothetical protein
MRYNSNREGSNTSNSRFDNKIPLQGEEEYKSYIDSQVIMKLLMGEI